MGRILRVLLIALGLFLVFSFLRSTFASEQTRIRWRLESMAEGFSDTRLSPCMRGIAAEWRHASTSATRERLADGLRYLFMSEKDSETRAFPYRAELLRDTLDVELQRSDPPRARVAFELRFERLAQGEWSPTWHVAVRGDMERHSELGWQLVRTEHDTLESDGKLWR